MEPYEGHKVVSLHVDIAFDVHIELEFTIDLVEFDQNQGEEILTEHMEGQEGESKIIRPVIFNQMVESCV